MKFIATIVLVSLSLVFFPRDSFASDFSSQIKSNYDFDPEGYVNVTNTIKIINNKSELTPKSYKITFTDFDPDNFVAYENGKLLKYQKSKEGKLNIYTVYFETENLGIDSEKSFLYNYGTSSLASKYDGGWEISVPFNKKDSDSKFLESTLVLPKSFGKISYVSEKPLSIKESEDKVVYKFQANVDSQKSIYVSFGEFSLYNFEIDYHLENPLNIVSYAQIALVPDTENQTVYFDEISPTPESVFRDADGNWIGIMRFNPREKIDVVTRGMIQVFPGRIREFNFAQDYLNKLLVSSEYWEVDDGQIKDLATKLGSVKEVHDYIVDNFEYFYSRPTDVRLTRKGALNALETPNTNVCTEFTDTFVTLSRAIKIPAREINGYAFTENNVTNPISISEDVLHSWAEFYDYEERTFRPVDPTWSKTSGINYFENFDTKHIAFVIHGLSSTKPFSPGTYKLGKNPKNDVRVTRSNSPQERKSGALEISLTKLPTLNPFSSKYKISLKNIGGSALYKVDPVLHDNENKLYSFSIEHLLPFERKDLFVDLPVAVLGIGTPKNYKLEASSKEFLIYSGKNEAVSVQLILIFSLTAIITITAVTLSKPRQ